ncbi:MAG: protein arginine kinase [Candidatus Omnitrophica bacterium]|nr:protein arginine kinase [Candidatus Omnitrophota bacterium]
MRIDDLINHTSEWLKGSGPYSNIVISSRVRLARNLNSIPFPHRLNKKQGQEVIDAVRTAVEKVDFLKGSLFIDMQQLDALDKQFLIERHLMSYEHARPDNYRALVLEKSEIISIMINEEDHLRIQVMQSGFSLFEAWSIMNRIDDVLSEHLDFAFLSEWGYLTSCPTNTGTGLRGSVMLHLPALVMSRQINRVLSAIAKLSFTTRGLYGEGTEASGNFFQVSNQVALGHKEEEIISNINALIKQVIEQEEQMRQHLFTHQRAILEDKIWRSFGILKSAFIISSQETIDLLSMLRLGVDLDIIKDIDRSTINRLFLITQPAHLQKIENKRLSSHERDVKRAEIIRKTLEKIS